ncbi:dihydrofolate reductase [Geomobilimonas luticola]|uniref:Dihydrofolate reductase n=1 Tax=Geomobilimonas luticola TaxID=1114878 RepID=A0ABS5SBH1_9BACT|nr:dihydrofolate reductase [Geomobilimonas luticola]MBT0652723.1 dihydrofolate reductase [Geomobilimonas luticola]
MIVSLIAAMAENRVIGSKGGIPWHLPADLAHFRELTTGHPVIMGRTTFASIGRPLPGRRNLVLSRTAGFRAEGVEVFASLEDALAACTGADEVFIGGGGEVYREALPRADRIYLTVVHRYYEGDTFFPEIPGDFREVLREERDGPPPFSWLVLKRHR